MTAEDFRVACAILNLNYKQMAERIGVSFGTTSRWANGNSRIPKAAEILINRMVDEKNKAREFGIAALNVYDEGILEDGLRLKLIEKAGEARDILVDIKKED